LPVEHPIMVVPFCKLQLVVVVHPSADQTRFVEIERSATAVQSVRAVVLRELVLDTV